MSDEYPSSPALAALERCRQNLRAAHIDMTTATHRITGARHARADELAGMVADALCYAERLCFVVQADQRYEAQRDRR